MVLISPFSLNIVPTYSFLVIFLQNMGLYSLHAMVAKPWLFKRSFYTSGTTKRNAMDTFFNVLVKHAKVNYLIWKHKL